MKKITDYQYLILFLFCLLTGFSQPLKGQSFEIMKIGESGCSAAFPSVPNWNYNVKGDGTKTWSGAVEFEGTKYGILCMEFSDPKSNLSEAELSVVLAGYLDNYMERFKIVEHSGYITGLEMESNPLATGISDTWTTAELQYWKIKAWINPNHMAFLYMYGLSGLADLKNAGAFLDSFAFQE